MPTTVFILERFNPIRAERGAPAAEVRITSIINETSKLLWMSKSDIAKNIKIFDGKADISGLLMAMEHYRTRKEFRR